MRAWRKRVVQTAAVALLVFATTPAGDAAAVVGGEEVTGGRPAPLVSLREHGAFACGGALIARDLVLTAAHCVVGTALKDLTVGAGAGDRTRQRSHPVVGVEVHEDFGKGPGLYAHDLALVRLARPTTGIRPLALPPADAGTPAGRAVRLAGWGLTEHGDQPVTPRAVTETVLPDAACETAHAGRTHRRTHLCATAPVGQGACGGDSGSPLVADGIVYGLYSWSVKPCAQGPAVPDVATSVPAHRQWIAERTGL